MALERFRLEHPAYEEILDLVEVSPQTQIYRIEGDIGQLNYGLFARCSFCDFPNAMEIMAESRNGQLVCERCAQELMANVAHNSQVRHGRRAERERAAALELLENPVRVTVLVRREVFVRDGFSCRYCGVFADPLCIDHVVPQSRGGSHRIENLVTACKSCNSRKSDRTPEDAGMPLLPIEVTA